MGKRVPADREAPVLVQVVDQVTEFSGPAVTDPAELASLSTPLSGDRRPVGMVDRLIEFTDQAVTDDVAENGAPGEPPVSQNRPAV
jgi:hypothetical protein